MSNLEELEGDVRLAIKSAHRNRRRIDGAVNWADLHPCMIATVTPLAKFGQPYTLIEIEEASPDADKFCMYIHDWLGRKGWKNVVVNTEW